jgi:hypothetical protein
VVNVPNPDNPDRPFKVGEVRLDGGRGVAKVTDADAWLSWCAEHAGTEVVSYLGGRTAFQLDHDSRRALMKAHLEAISEAERRGFDADIPGAFLDGLERAGYTITPVVVTEPRNEVRPAWTDAVLKASQKAGTPVTPHGEIPDGIAVVESAATPYVRVERDEGRRGEFVASKRGRLAEITGGQ